MDNYFSIRTELHDAKELVSQAESLITEVNEIRDEIKKENTIYNSLRETYKIYKSYGDDGVAFQEIRKLMSEVRGREEKLLYKLGEICRINNRYLYDYSNELESEIEELKAIIDKKDEEISELEAELEKLKSEANNLT